MLFQNFYWELGCKPIAVNISKKDDLDKLKIALKLFLAQALHR